MHSTRLTIIVCILLLTGCVGLNGSWTSEEFRVGTTGLEARFVENNPPRIVDEDSPFSIAVDVRNRGAYLAEDIYINVGVERDYMCINSGDECVSGINEKIDEIRGKSQYLPTGDYEILRFNAQTKGLEGQRTTHRATLLLSKCYKYTTKIESEVCINPNEGSDSSHDVCSTSPRTYNNQGAPIAVKKVEGRMMVTDGGDKVKPIITIDIENAGRGSVIERDKISKFCKGEGVDRYNHNIVYLKELQIGNEKYIEGSGDNTIECRRPVAELSRNEGSIVCEFKEGISKGSAAYNARMMAVFEYGYTESTSRQVEITK